MNQSLPPLGDFPGPAREQTYEILNRPSGTRSSQHAAAIRQQIEFVKPVNKTGRAFPTELLRESQEVLTGLAEGQEVIVGIAFGGNAWQGVEQFYRAVGRQLGGDPALLVLSRAGGFGGGGPVGCPTILG